MPKLDAAIVILAGGEATRFPGKLERELHGEALVVRAYHRACETAWPVYVAGKGSFSKDVDAQLDCPMLIDRWPGTGPVGALLSACGEIPHEYVFAVAADEPLLDRTVFERLADAIGPDDDAVIPSHGGRIEPLAALYKRTALLEKSFETMARDRRAMHELIDRLRARFVDVPARYFANINTPAALALAQREGV